MNLLSSIVLIALSGWLMTDLAVNTSFSSQRSASFSALNHSLAGAQAADLLSERDAIFVATNQQRARKGLPGLRQDAKLRQSAQAYAELMAAKDVMSHTLNGLSLPDKAKRVGYAYKQLSENIALNTRLDGRSVVVDQWMESKGHRKNLLAKDITDIGIGIAGPSKQHRYYYCQLFGVQL